MADTSKRSAAKKSTSRSRNTKSSDNPELQASDEVRTAIITGVTFGTKAVQYAVVDGRAIFEGDIDLGSVEDLEKSNDAMRGLAVEESVIITGSQFRWPGGVVPYEIDPAMPDQQRVHDAIAHWEQHTVIRFVLRTAANAGEPPELGALHPRRRLLLGGRHAGQRPAGHLAGHRLRRRPRASTRSATRSGCGTSRAVEDRDLFVTIHWENIQAGKEHNFNQHIADGDDVGAYDYGSIMHYERTAFTKNGQETVTPINPANAQIGQRVALSAGDLAAVASMYGSPPVTFKKVADDGGTVNVKKFSRRRTAGAEEAQRRPAAVQEALRRPTDHDQEGPRRRPAGEEAVRRPARRVQEDTSTTARSSG